MTFVKRVCARVMVNYWATGPLVLSSRRTKWMIANELADLKFS